LNKKKTIVGSSKFVAKSVPKNIRGKEIKKRNLELVKKCEDSEEEGNDSKVKVFSYQRGSRFLMNYLKCKG
jgi:hypothetical protein